MAELDTSPGGWGTDFNVPSELAHSTKRSCTEKTQSDQVDSTGNRVSDTAVVPTATSVQSSLRMTPPDSIRGMEIDMHSSKRTRSW